MSTGDRVLALGVNDSVHYMTPTANPYRRRKVNRWWSALGWIAVIFFALAYIAALTSR